MFTEIHQPGDPVADILFNWLPFLGALLAGAAGLVMLSLGFRAYLKAALLRKYGVRGQAAVREKWIRKSYVRREERNRTTPLEYHYLRVERSDNGRTYSTTEVAPIALWQEKEPGDAVDVIYLPRRSLMRLAGWSDGIGHAAGMTQMIVGAFLTSASAAVLITGILEATSGPDYRIVGTDWAPDRAEVLSIGTPADPYLRLFAPGKKYLQVVFGDTRGGALMANQRLVLVSPEQIQGLDIEEGDILRAWINPADEYQAVLDLERRR